MPRIVTVGLGIPEHFYTQEEVFAVLEHRRLYWNYFAGAGIKKRHLCYPPAVFVKTSPQEAHQNYEKSAIRLSLQAIRGCLAQADLLGRDIDLVVFGSCTGFTVPGLEHLIGEEMEFKEEMIAHPMTGIGCGASGPILERAWEHLRLYPTHRALVVLCEVSHAAYHPDKNNNGVILGNAIFGDGAACILMEGSWAPGLHIMDCVSLHDYKHARDVAMTWADARLKLVLPARTSELSTPMIKKVVDRLLTKAGLRIDDIAQLVIHSGGSSILREALGVLGVDRERLKWSFHVWENYGNMSSATAPFALHYLLQSKELKKGDKVVMVTLGAGFEADGALMEWF